MSESAPNVESVEAISNGDKIGSVELVSVIPKLYSGNPDSHKRTELLRDYIDTLRNGYQG